MGLGHYWRLQALLAPDLGSAVFGSYIEVHYPGNALDGFGGAVGVSNIKEGRVGTNLVWTPLLRASISAPNSCMYI